MRSRPVARAAVRTVPTAAAILLACASASRAADRLWTGFGTSGNFNVAANWSNLSPPGATGDAALFGWGAARRNVVYINTGPTLASLAVLAPTVFGPYEFRGGGSQLNVDGQFSVSDTSLSMTSGASISADVLYVVAGAGLSINNADLAGTDSAIYGNFVLANGSGFSASTVDVSNGGKMTVAGASSVTSTNYVDVGNGSSGTLEVAGVLTSLTAGGRFQTRWALANGTASVTLSNASLTTLNSGLQVARFGASSQADVTIKSGATLDLNGPLEVTGTTATDGAATIRVEAASLNANSWATFGNRSSLLLAPDARAAFQQDVTFNTGSILNIKEGAALIVSPEKMLTFDGGTATIQSDVYYPSNSSMFRIRGSSSVEAQGTFDLRTGTLYVDGNGKLENTSATKSSTWANSGGWVAQVRIFDNGSVIYRNALTICGTGGAASVVQEGGLFKTRSLTVGGGAASSAFIYLDGGTFEHDSVELRRGTTLVQSGGTWSAVRELTMRDNAILNMTQGKGLSLKVEKLTLFDQARINLNDNEAVIDYLGTSPIDLVTQSVRNAYNNGNWLGNGITSAVATLDQRMAVGLFDSAGVITIRATLAGDADMDYRVNFNDLLLLAANYNQSGRTWQKGDFNYDGVANFDDLLRLAANYNQSLTGSLGGDWALARASVPEPLSLSIVSAAATACLCRRRRSASGLR